MKTLDKDESERLKANGKGLAASKRKEQLKTARVIAKEIAARQGTVTSDDVAVELDNRALERLGPAAGSLFTTSDFMWTGQRVRSKQPLNHGREIRVWKLNQRKETGC